MIALTPNQATIFGALGGAALGAVLGGIVSLFTTRYLVKHGPNYGEQIGNINETLAKLVQTQDELKQHQAQAYADEKQRYEEENHRAEAARWKPCVGVISKVEGDKQANTLVLKSPQSFFVNEVSLISPGGAKLFDYNVLGYKASSTGFSVPIPHESLNKVADMSPTFFQQETFDGAFRYSVQREGKDGVAYTGEIPFHGKRVYLRNNCSFKLNG